MLGLTHLQCRACGRLRPLRFAYLVASVPALGIKVECGHCGHVAFTLIHGRYAYCPACQALAAVRPAEGSLPGRLFACCARCDRLLATLEGDPHLMRSPSAPLSGPSAPRRGP